MEGPARRTTAPVAVGLLALTAALLVPVQARAQSFSLGYQTESWGYDEIGRLHGGLLRVRWGNGVELALEVAGTRGRSTGTPCLSFPRLEGSCPEEPLATTSESLAFTVGYSGLSLETAVGAFRVPLSVGFSGTRFEHRGGETGMKSGDSQLHADFGMGLRYRSPGLWSEHVGIFAELRISSAVAIEPDDCISCADPLHGGAGRMALAVGFVFGPGRR